MNPAVRQRELPADHPALCALVFAMDPAGIGGVLLRGMPGPGRDAWMAVARSLLPDSAPWVRVPVSVSPDRLLGGLDFAATIALGKPVFATGLLQAADKGVLVLSMAERLGDVEAAIVGRVLECRELRVEREGMTRSSSTRFGIVACDEGLDDDEVVSAGLRERLALFLPTDGLPPEGPDLWEWAECDLEAARARLPGVAVGNETLAEVCALAAAFGIVSARAGLLALRVARILAALAGKPAVTSEETRLAAELVLPQRARCLPDAPPPDESEAPPPPDTRDRERDSTEEAPPPRGRQTPDSPDEVTVEAVRALLPPHLLEELAAATGGRVERKTGGRSGLRGSSARRRGRPAGIRHADSLHGQRLNVLATLKAAAPWQGLRTGPVDRPDGGLKLRRDDFRVTRFKEHVETTTIFLVDASGSQAARRLAEAKGAVELLLQDCYVRRDRVALLAFRGTTAEVLLPPTRALARARRSLAALPGGGGTPLAAGLDAVRDMAQAVMHSGRDPAVVVLTDGRANVARDARPGAEAAERDALNAARGLKVEGVRSLLLDTSVRPRPRARKLALAMGARYIPLPQADAAGISDSVRQSLSS